MEVNTNASESKLEDDKFDNFAKHFVDSDSARLGRSFIPRASDVFVSTASKCGTTWISQICHSLRSHGDNSFDDLDEVVPWNVFAPACGQDVNADHTYHPRIFKTHDRFEEINKLSFEDPGCKYIVVCRDPVNAGLSLYNFMPLTAGKSIVECIESFWENPVDGPISFSFGNWPALYLSWFNASKLYKDKILWTFYEDLLDDAEGEIKRIIKFMDLSVETGSEEEEKLIKTALECSSKDFMVSNVTKFDGHFILFKRNVALEKAGLHLGVEAAQKVTQRQNLSDQRRLLTEYVKQAWPKQMASTGYDNYEDFKTGVKELFY